MRRAGRMIYNGAVAVSLQLCLGTVGVWVRSYWVSDWLQWYDWPDNGSFLDQKSIYSSRGGIKFDAWHYSTGNIHSRDHAHFRHDREGAKEYAAVGDKLDHSLFPKPRHYAALGIEWIPQQTGRWFESAAGGVVFRSLTLPLYFPTLLFALLPAHYFLRVRRQRRLAGRRARGCCVFCGYDLRASGGRCPECGRRNDE